MLKTIHDKILIDPIIEKEQKTASGIILPDDKKKRIYQGTVISAGTDENNTVKEGDLVFFDFIKAVDINVNGFDYMMVKEEDIIGIFEEG